MFTGLNSYHPNDFTKTVLRWDFETISEPLASVIENGPLPKSEQNVAEYYANFLPLILEEARAIIANGLEQADKQIEPKTKNRGKNKNSSNASNSSDAKTFHLTLKKQSNLPKTEGNPMSLFFRGSIPHTIEHGSSMNVLLLTTTGIYPEKKFIALATENQEHDDVNAKIIISSTDYAAYEECFLDRARWEVNYLGSVISEQRMYDACLEETNFPCIKKIAEGSILTPNIKVPAGLLNVEHLNLSQREAIYAFMNAKEGSTLLLQGPPGTGKTTTLVALLKQVAYQGKRTMVSAHSNKGVQVLALRAIDELADVPMIVVGVESKLHEKLKPIFLNKWYDEIMLSFSLYLEEIELIAQESSELSLSQNKLILEIEKNVSTAQQSLNKFNLIYSNSLASTDKKALLALSNDPILATDFQGFKSHIDQLKRQPESNRLWAGLFTILSRLVDKWTKVKKYEIEAFLLDHAMIIFSTLITAGRKNMLTMAPVDFLLVDEAAQSVEAATLIPMRFQPKKVLLVGDTKQLPATVISRALDDSDRRFLTNYKWSMMWRLIEENKQPALMLEIQYRMHPHICQWPSGQYYGHRLVTAPTILPITPLNTTDITSRPYGIYQISGQAEMSDNSKSVRNTLEASYVIKIIEHIRQKNKLSTIGIITPYAGQKRLISESLTRRNNLQQLVDVNTVDGFQGDERDIIIISFARTHVSEFLKEFRRLNVAITRAKACLIILGSPSLSSNDIGQLMADAKRRHILYTEQDLNQILTTGKIINRQHAPATDPLVLAWRGEARDQVNYAKTVSEKGVALLWYRRAAENNDPEAQFYIGQVYFNGNEFFKKDINLALNWLNKSSRQNCSLAQVFLGKLCISGDCVVKNVTLGIDLCERAARDNVIEAIVFLSKLYDEGIEVPRNVANLEKYYRQAAKLGDLSAMEKLAKSLFDGTLDNQRESLKWYRMLAQKNITTSYYPLAQLLNSISDNQVDALKWYLKGAEEGNKDAQYEVALRFKNGSYGCATDILKSNNFFRLAAISGHMLAQFTYASFLMQEGKSSEAMPFFKLAADQGHSESQYLFGLLMSKKNIHEAYVYYLTAADQNHALAQYECILYQIQFNRDLKRCLSFCEKLSVQGNAKIQFLYARILDTGLVGGIPDKIKAYAYYSQLAQNQHPLAQYYCAILLEEGVGVERDIVRARRYYGSCLEQCFRAKLRLACLLLREEDRELQKSHLDHTLSTEDNYQRPEELLEYYFNNYQEEKYLENTTEHYLENLVLASPAKNFIYNIDVINTGSPRANYLLGRIFEEGKGVIPDIKRALQHYERASIQHAEASYRAGYIYETGFGVAQSSATAKKYYQSAAKKGHDLAGKRLTWSYLMFARHTIPDDDTLRRTEPSKCVVM